MAPSLGCQGSGAWNNSALFEKGCGPKVEPNAQKLRCNKGHTNQVAVIAWSDSVRLYRPGHKESRTANEGATLVVALGIAC